MITRSVTRSVAGVRFASSDAKDKFKIVVIGGGTGGLSVSNQIYNRFKTAGKALANGDIAIVDLAEYHHYQPGWTLVGAGLKDKSALRRRLSTLIPPHMTHVPANVSSFSPESSSLSTTSGRTLFYEILVVAAGLNINWSSVSGLSRALADPTSGVSSIYSYETCDKAWSDIDTLRSGTAVFTQPAGVIKCAGAPQKIMWMAWDRFRQTGRADNVKTEFFTGMPTMFSVKKYSDALDALRIERGIPGLFEHNLIAIDVSKRKATFKRAGTDGAAVEADYTILHVTPPMGPLDVIKKSSLADAAGWVDVDPGTMRHKKFTNVFSLGDCSSLPTSKTAAAITAQAPILSENVFSVMESGNVSAEAYDGYTSCPLLTGYGQLMLAEFKYGLQPKETFAGVLGDQSRPRRLFYHLKKDFFPWVYYRDMIRGTWFGASGFSRPIK